MTTDRADGACCTPPAAPFGKPNTWRRHPCWLAAGQPPHPPHGSGAHAGRDVDDDTAGWCLHATTEMCRGT